MGGRLEEDGEEEKKEGTEDEEEEEEEETLSGLGMMGVGSGTTGTLRPR
jgi:hypothetical protein